MIESIFFKVHLKFKMMYTTILIQFWCVHSLHLHCNLLYGKCSSGRFSCKNTNLLTFSVDKADRLAVIILPAVLKSLSEVVEVATIARYF